MPVRFCRAAQRSVEFCRAQLCCASHVMHCFVELGSASPSRVGLCSASPAMACQSLYCCVSWAVLGYASLVGLSRYWLRLAMVRYVELRQSG